MKKAFSIIIALTFVVGASAQDTKKVYATEHGKKYHTHADCQYIKGRGKEISLDKAKAKDLELCSRCESKDKKAKEDKSKDTKKK